MIKKTHINEEIYYIYENSVIKVLAVPKLIYKFSVIPPPPKKSLQDFLGNIEKLIIRFIWKDKKVHG